MGVYTEFHWLKVLDGVDTAQIALGRAEDASRWRHSELGNAMSSSRLHFLAQFSRCLYAPFSRGRMRVVEAG